MLEKAGHAIDVVEDGAATIEAVRAGQYDLVLMDAQMPLVDGLEATRRIRRLEVAKAGMNDYVTKPIDRARLLSTVACWGARAG